MVTLDSEVYHVASSNDANDTLLTSLREAATAVQTSVMAFNMAGERGDFFLSDNSLKNVDQLVSTLCRIAERF